MFAILTALELGIAPAAPNFRVPSVIVVAPVYALLALEIVRAEFALFWIRPVTFEPMAADIVVPPIPVPEFVIVPVLLIAVVDSVTPASVALSFFKIRLPVPVAPPDSVSSFVPLELVSVVPAEFTARAPDIVKAEVVLFSITLVTLEPIPPDIVVVPVPAPILVTVPVLFIAAVEKVMVPEVAFSSMVRLLVPVTPPLKVVDIAVPVFPMVRVPVVVDANTRAFA